MRTVLVLVGASVLAAVAFVCCLCHWTAGPAVPVPPTQPKASLPPPGWSAQQQAQDLADWRARDATQTLLQLRAAGGSEAQVEAVVGPPDRRQDAILDDGTRSSYTYYQGGGEVIQLHYVNGHLRGIATY